jgi:hypothetical protein
MVIPDPEIGLVIHFNYLWKREHERGRDNARYARPCAVILAQRRDSDGTIRVVVAPVTHAPPAADTVGVEIPLAVKTHLGLDAERSWIITDEVNEFVWPGFDLQPNAAGRIAYGLLPNRLFQRVRRSVLGCLEAQRLARVMR